MKQPLGHISVLVSWCMQRLNRWKQRIPRQLRLQETLSLGEHRVLAVVACGKQILLIGSTGNSLSLLANLSEVKPSALVDDVVPLWTFQEPRTNGGSFELHRAES